MLWALDELYPVAVGILDEAHVTDAAVLDADDVSRAIETLIDGPDDEVEQAPEIRAVVFASAKRDSELWITDISWRQPETDAHLRALAEQLNQPGAEAQPPPATLTDTRL